jgi:hypothetical protein
MKRKAISEKRKERGAEITPETSPSGKTSILSGRKLHFAIISLIGITTLAIGGYRYYSQYQTRINQKKMSTAEATSLAGVVGKLITVPADEIPTIATVVDKEKVMGQPFFAHAENGDKVLIYKNANKAYLYRPGYNKIIEVGPINSSQTTQVTGAKVSSASAQLQKGQSSKKEVKVAIFNGTNIQGLAAETGKVLDNQLPQVSITRMGNAAQRYTKTLVVDISGHPAEATAIAQALGGEVGPLPVNEETASVDILVIVGK